MAEVGDQNNELNPKAKAEIEGILRRMAEEDAGEKTTEAFKSLYFEIDLSLNSLKIKRYPYPFKEGTINTTEIKRLGGRVIVYSEKPEEPSREDKIRIEILRGRLGQKQGTTKEVVILGSKGLTAIYRKTFMDESGPQMEESSLSKNPGTAYLNIAKISTILKSTAINKK